jgi:hypothetical protein
MDRLHGSALHDGWCAACRKVLTNFANESAFLTADNIRYEPVTIHRSQEVLKMLSSLHIYILAINFFFKKHRYNNLSCTYSTPDTNFHWMASAVVLPFLY